MPSRIEICETSLTSVKVDAIVCTAHPTLLPSTKEEQAVHVAAGPMLMEECKHVAPCQVGAARITRGYNLPASYVIHTVGPAWGGGESNEDEYLKLCYRNCFELAKSFHIKSIAFPPISIGPNGFPPARAAFLAMTEITSYLKTDTELNRIVICCVDEQSTWDYEAAFDKCTTK